MLDNPSGRWPCYTEEEIQAVVAVLRTGRVNYWTGEECRQFEREFADWVGTNHAIAVANGTVAIDLALKAIGIGAGDEVVVTPRTFIASASCIVNAGAKPVFADVDRESGNLTAGAVEAVLTERSKAIIVVHLGGYPADMHSIMALARQRGLKVIEDCAQAHGARYRGRSVGSIGDIGAWSFCQDKIMTTGGEGGMVTVDDPGLWHRMWAYKDHGKSWQAVYERAHEPGFRWLHDEFGTNWRMMEIQAVLGRIQLRRMGQWTAKRNAYANIMHEALLPLAGDRGPVRLTPLLGRGAGAGSSVHAYYRFYCYVRPENLAPGWTRDRIVNEITKAGMAVFQGSCSEIYLEEAFQRSDLAPKRRLPVARELGETSLAFLVHPTLTEEDVRAMAGSASDVIETAAADC